MTVHNFSTILNNINYIGELKSIDPFGVFTHQIIKQILNMKSISLQTSNSINKDHLLGTVEIIIAFSLAGSSLIVAKLLSFRVPIFLTTVLSLSFAFLTMLPFQWSKRSEIKKLNKTELKLMFFQALFGIVLFRVFTLWGLQHTTAANASIVTSATPAVMALLSVIFLKEKMGRNILIGITTALIGLVLINVNDIRGIGGVGFLFGNSLIGLAVISEVMLTIFRKFTKTQVSSITNTTLLSLIAIVLMVPFAIFELQSFSITLMELKDWLAIAYYGSIATAAAYIFWGDGALKIPATYIGVTSVFMPITALLLSSLVLGEELTHFHWLGCCMGVFGIIICNLSTTKTIK